jgi:hypothetical protein
MVFYPKGLQTKQDDPRPMQSCVTLAILNPHIFQFFDLIIIELLQLCRSQLKSEISLHEVVDASRCKAVAALEPTDAFNPFSQRQRNSFPKAEYLAKKSLVCAFILHSALMARKKQPPALVFMTPSSLKLLSCTHSS